MELTHLDARGNAHMVNVGAKPVTERTATAAGRLLVSAEVIALLRGPGVPKGDALGVARVAGIIGGQADRGADPTLPSAGSFCCKHRAFGE